jgi:hypothetical protein
MKDLFLVLFCLFALTGNSQERINTHFYLNDTEIDIDNVFINPMSIDSLFVDKKTNDGEVYIIANEPIEFITLDTVLTRHTNLDKKQNKILYIVENKVIKSESKVLIDSSFFIYVKTNYLNEVDYLNENLKSLVIVDISLKTEKQITIRGDRKAIDNLIYK